MELPRLPQAWSETLNTNRNISSGPPTEAYIHLSDRVMNLSGLNRTDKLLYSVIAGFSGRNSCCYAGNGYLAAKVGVSRSTVTHSLCRLERRGLIRRVIRPDLGNLRIIEAVEQR